MRIQNLGAGSHAVPHNLREIQAALRAGERTWSDFPYYAWRYGERGEQFTHSDSAWLTTLADHQSAVIEQQDKWLGRVLAARGMPQWMLELHLYIVWGSWWQPYPTDSQCTHACGWARRRCS